MTGVFFGLMGIVAYGSINDVKFTIFCGVVVIGALVAMWLARNAARRTA